MTDLREQLAEIMLDAADALIASGLVDAHETSSREPQAESGDVDHVARALHFDFCDQMGWPNGQPTWDEMPEGSARSLAADTLARETWRSLARAALAALSSRRETWERAIEAAANAVEDAAPVTQDLEHTAVAERMLSVAGALRAIPYPGESSDAP